MPNLITHYFFAEDVIELLPENLKTLIGKYRTAYNLGAVGPDFLFTLREIGDVSARYCNRIHYAHVYDVFAKTAVFLNRNRNDEQVAYMLGFMTHYVADHILHPFVNYFAEEGLTKEYGPRYQRHLHGIIESAVDEWILIKKEKNPRTFSSFKCVSASIATKKQVGALYRDVINKVYRYDVSNYKIRFSFNICRMFGIIWMDKFKFKKRLVSWIEDTLGIKKTLSSLMRPPVGYGTIDLLNENKKPWRKIRNVDGELSDKSFAEMYEIIKTEAVRYLGEYMDAVVDRKALDRKDFVVNYEGIQTEWLE